MDLALLEDKVLLSVSWLIWTEIFCENITDVEPVWIMRVINKLSIEAVEWIEARGKLSVCSLQINYLVAWLGHAFVPSKSSIAQTLSWCFACRSNLALWKKQQLFCLEVVGSIRVLLIGMECTSQHCNFCCHVFLVLRKKLLIKWVVSRLEFSKHEWNLYP